MIAIVEDHESVRDALLRLMRQAGFAARAFPSAEEFFASDERHQMSCVVTDMCMQSMSGLELQERLLAEQNRALIIFITGHADELPRMQASQNGAIGFLLRPFDGDLLINMVQTASQSQA
jgi:FixJ family two-component response regulator